jgi:hypothetical protein
LRNGIVYLGVDTRCGFAHPRRLSSVVVALRASGRTFVFCV